MNDIKKLEALLYRTENNIKFYLDHEKANSAMNEIGVMRGILYAIEELTGSQKSLTKKELSYIQLQQEIKAIYDEIELEESNGR